MCTPNSGPNQKAGYTSLHFNGPLSVKEDQKRKLIVMFLVFVVRGFDGLADRFVIARKS